MIVEIRTKLYEILSNIHPRVWYEVAPDNSEFPYLTHVFENSDYDGANTELFTLFVDGWDDNVDTTTLENLMDSVNNILEKSINVINDDLSFRVVLDRRLNITDPDVRIRRRRYEYQIRAMRK